jgi:hypothetical protein
MMIINNELKNVFKSFIDELLRENSLSLPCKLIYETSSFVECVNCNLDPISHKSINTYKNNGPIFFSDGQICPYCRGLGGIYEQAYDIKNLLVLFDYKYWVNFDSKIYNSQGTIQTINKLEDYPKIKNCNKLIVDVNTHNYTESYYQRNSDPQPAGFGESSYFFTYWKKI